MALALRPEKTSESIFTASEPGGVFCPKRGSVTASRRDVCSKNSALVIRTQIIKTSFLFDIKGCFSGLSRRARPLSGGRKTDATNSSPFVVFKK
jgi:hypothetical protein